MCIFFLFQLQIWGSMTKHENRICCSSIFHSNNALIVVFSCMRYAFFVHCYVILTKKTKFTLVKMKKKENKRQTKNLCFFFWFPISILELLLIYSWSVDLNFYYCYSFVFLSSCIPKRIICAIFVRKVHLFFFMCFVKIIINFLVQENKTFCYK